MCSVLVGQGVHTKIGSNRLTSIYVRACVAVRARPLMLLLALSGEQITFQNIPEQYKH